MDVVKAFRDVILLQEQCLVEVAFWKCGQHRDPPTGIK
jgi:hypothetical protein